MESAGFPNLIVCQDDFADVYVTKQQKIYSNFIRRNHINKTALGHKGSHFKQKHSTLKKVYLEPITHLNYLKERDYLNSGGGMFSSMDENMNVNFNSNQNHP